jgi:hypothetical protein
LGRRSGCIVDLWWQDTSECENNFPRRSTPALHQAEEPKLPAAISHRRCSPHGIGFVGTTTEKRERRAVDVTHPVTARHPVAIAAAGAHQLPCWPMTTCPSRDRQGVQTLSMQAKPVSCSFPISPFSHRFVIPASPRLDCYLGKKPMPLGCRQATDQADERKPPAAISHRRCERCKTHCSISSLAAAYMADGCSS